MARQREFRADAAAVRAHARRHHRRRVAQDRRPRAGRGRRARRPALRTCGSPAPTSRRLAVWRRWLATHPPISEAPGGALRPREVLPARHCRPRTPTSRVDLAPRAPSPTARAATRQTPTPRRTLRPAGSGRRPRPTQQDERDALQRAAFWRKPRRVPRRAARLVHHRRRRRGSAVGRVAGTGGSPALRRTPAHGLARPQCGSTLAGLRRPRRIARHDRRQPTASRWPARRGTWRRMDRRLRLMLLRRVLRGTARTPGRSVLRTRRWPSPRRRAARPCHGARRVGVGCRACRAGPADRSPPHRAGPARSWSPASDAGTARAAPGPTRHCAPGRGRPGSGAVPDRRLPAARHAGAAGARAPCRSTADLVARAQVRLSAQTAASDTETTGKRARARRRWCRRTCRKPSMT